MATSTSSRSAAQAARTGRSASELAGIGAPLARAYGQRERLTQMQLIWTEGVRVKLTNLGEFQKEAQ